MSHAHAHPTVIPNPSHTPMVVPTDRQGARVEPVSGHAHQWIMSALFSVDEHVISQCVAAFMTGCTAPGIGMDYDSLLSVVGPICLKCNQPLSVTTAVMPCPVVVVPVLGAENNRR